MSSGSLASTPYTDTYIIECNRQSSIEANGGNDNHTNIFTNKQGQGIRLEAGDKVSIHSAFINEIGNTDGTIEIKGQTIKDSNGKEIKYSLTETQDTLSQEFPLDDIAIPNTTEPWTDTAIDEAQYQSNKVKTAGAGDRKVQLCQPYGFQQCDSKNVDKEFSLRDDEMNFNINYYKTTNGEGYFHLPRGYDIADAKKMNTPEHGDTAEALSKAMDDTPDEFGMPFAYTGRQFDINARVDGEGVITDGSGDTITNGLLIPPRPESRVKSEWRNYSVGNTTTRGEVPAYAGDGSTYGWNLASTLGQVEGIIGEETDCIPRRINDNSKYTIFKKERTFFNPPPDYEKFIPDAYLGKCLTTELQRGANEYEADNDHPFTNDFVSYNNNTWDGVNVDSDLLDAPTNAEGTSIGDSKYSLQLNQQRRDPACTGNWVPYTEIKNIKLDTGFHSPEDVAKQITEQLTKTNTGTPIFASVGTNVMNSNQININSTSRAFHQIGIKKDGECFKNFYCANHNNFSQTNANNYFVESVGKFGDTGVAVHKTRKSIDYMSAYHYIGVKRPSFFMKGREFQISNLNEKGNQPAKVCQKYQVRQGVPFADRATGEIKTSIPWINRHKLNAFVEAQAEYPELFDYHFTNITSSAYSQYVDKNNYPLLHTDGQRLAGFVHMDVVQSRMLHQDGTSNRESDVYSFPPCRSGFGEASADQRKKLFLGDDNYKGKKFCDWHRHNNTRIPSTSQASNIPPSETDGGATYVDGSGSAYAPQTGLRPPHFNSSVSSGAGNGVVDTEDNRNYDVSSVPLWFWYDFSRAGLDEGGEVGCNDNNLNYGFMKKWIDTEDDGTIIGEFISFTTANIGGIPDHHYKAEGNPILDPATYANHRDPLELKSRMIGYDLHFNAYGNASIMLYSGQLNNVGFSANARSKLYSDFFYYASNSYLPFTDKQPAQSLATESLQPIWQFCNSTLLGSNSINCAYDSDGRKRFQFGNLHTPEYIGNVFDAGQNQENPINPDASAVVYKINKRLTGSNFTPEMVPYKTAQSIKTSDLTQKDQYVEISQFNHNMEQWATIYDAHSGVVFSNFGGNDTNKKHWHKCLWGLLGFDYNQLNKNYYVDNPPIIKDRMTLQSRLNPTNIEGAPFIYTNAFVKQGDITLWRKNIFGAGLFTQQTPNQGTIYSAYPWATTGFGNSSIDNCPAVVIDTESMLVNAERQPTKMLRPYFLIKSNIVGDMKYIGSGHNTEGGQLLPIVGVVNKENGFGDYYFQTDTKNIFTITQPHTLSEITTSIHDPDMSPARVDKNSAVLYMIQKMNTNNLNVVDATLQQGGALGREMMTELQPPQMSPAEYTEYFKSFILNSNQERMSAPKTTDPIPDTQIQLNTDMPRRERAGSIVGQRDMTPSSIEKRQRRGFHQLMSDVSTSGRRPLNFGSFQDASRTFHQERYRSNMGVRAGEESGRVLPAGSMRDRTPPQRIHQRFTSYQQTIPHAEQRAPTQRSEAVSGVSEPRQKL